MPACRLSARARPRPGVSPFQAVVNRAALMTLEQIAGIAHEPDETPAGVVVLTHGAGGNSESPLLQRLCDEWARRGWLAVRYNLPYRRRRPKGPPSGSAGSDRGRIVEAPPGCRRVGGG